MFPLYRHLFYDNLGKFDLELQSYRDYISRGTLYLYYVNCGTIEEHTLLIARRFSYQLYIISIKHTAARYPNERFADNGKF